MLCFNESGSGWVVVTRAYQRRGAIIKMRRSKDQAGPPDLMGTVLCYSLRTPPVYSPA